MATRKSRRISKATARGLIRAREAIYKRERDPFRAWEAYLAASTAGIKVPEWVSDYLLRVSMKLLGLSKAERLAGDELRAAVMRALEMEGVGRGTIFARRKALRRAQQLAVDVATLRHRTKAKTDWVVGEVARLHNVDRSTVERAYQRVKAQGGLLYPGGWETRPFPSPGLPQ